MFSLANKINRVDLFKIQEILNLVSVICIVVMLQFFRRSQRQVTAQCDIADLAASDYTIMVKNIPIKIEDVPENFDYDLELKKFLVKNATPGKNVNIVSVNLV
jgi:hypothetical protein